MTRKFKSPVQHIVFVTLWSISGALSIAAALAATAAQGGNVMKRESGHPGAQTGLATFAGGCFWCMEPPFEKLAGVLSVRAGFTGGEEKSPTYEQVSAGDTRHLEAIEVVYDQRLVTYNELLDLFWCQIDPTDPGGQFADRGAHYRTAIFFHNEDQRRLAEQSKQTLEKSGRFAMGIATAIRPAGSFYPAEEYHQNYYSKNPEHYQTYRRGSGRQSYIDKTWGTCTLRPASQNAADWERFSKPTKEKLRASLSDLQYDVTQNHGTEPPFKNPYWDKKEPGIYVDVVSGEPLFSSRDKYDSGTGWPSFERPLVQENLVLRTDTSLGTERIEVRSRRADSHLGHVFNDGPSPLGLRYCINSAALRFVPASRLDEDGYGAFRNQIQAK